MISALWRFGCIIDQILNDLLLLWRKCACQRNIPPCSYQSQSPPSCITIRLRFYYDSYFPSTNRSSIFFTSVVWFLLNFCLQIVLVGIFLLKIIEIESEANKKAYLLFWKILIYILFQIIDENKHTVKSNKNNIFKTTIYSISGMCEVYS